MSYKKPAEERSFSDEDPSSIKKITAKAPTTTEYLEKENDALDNKLEQALEEIPKQLRTFSDAMKKRFVSQVLSDGNSEISRKYQKLQNDIKNDALIYHRAILPVCEEVVAQSQHFFDSFLSLDRRELAHQITGIQEELRNCGQLCNMAKRMNEDIVTALKQSEGKAHEIKMEIKELQQAYETRKTEFEASAALKRKVAIGFSFVPGINLFVTPALMIASNSDTKDARIQAAHAQTQGAAAIAVEETLVPALTALIKALESLAAFFYEMENEVDNCYKKGETAIRKRDMSESLYKLIAQKGRNVEKMCQNFRMVLPSVKTDFLAICPDDGSDETDVDHQYISKKLKDMLAMTKCLYKTPHKIIDNLKAQQQRQRQLANPSARETYNFYC